MVVQFNRKTLSDYLYLIGLSILAFALPLSNFLMSISQFVIVAAWFTGGSFKEKLARFWSNKSAVVLSSAFFLLLLGMIYTPDFSQGLNELKIKLPLLTLPFIFSSMPKLSEKKFKS